MKNKKTKTTKKFVTAVLVAYLLLLVFNKELFLSASTSFLDSILKIIPALLFVFVLMIAANYFMTPKRVINFSTKKGIRKWLLMILAGVLSAGPPFLWYPVLKKLKNHGLSPGLIATYLYSKALVISFLPLLIFYFPIKYIAVLYLVLVTAAIAQGIMIDKIIK